MSDRADRLRKLEEALDAFEDELDEEEEDGNRETWWRNFYECHSCDHEWTDIYNAQPDDDCPKCGAGGCSPVESEEVDGPDV